MSFWYILCYKPAKTMTALWIRLAPIAKADCEFVAPVQYASQAEDPHFKEALYSTLVDLKASTELLQMDSPELAAYLRSTGGLPEKDAVRPSAPIGPLSPSQVITLVLSYLPKSQGARASLRHICLPSLGVQSAA